MSANKHRPHVRVIPEDDANRQIAIGFRGNIGVDFRRIEIDPPAGGWSHVLEIYELELVALQRRNHNVHVVMLIDFDEKGEHRRSNCEARIPDDLKSRTFIIGTSDEPEVLAKGLNKTLEKTGNGLADDCLREDLGNWGHAQLSHNLSELKRMVATIKPFVFQGS